MEGLIFSIKLYAVHDGPGIRVTVFMKGCPLSCWWCHNPEGISTDAEKVLQDERVGDMEFLVEKDVGQYYSPDQVLQILDKQRIFLTESQGGITFSGGEPLLQPDFLLETLMICREAGYHTAVDTSGYVDQLHLVSIIPYTDLFLFDLKHLDPHKHLLYTGVSNELILKNLDMILESGKDIFIRFPVLPGINDDTEHLEMLRSYLVKPGAGNLLRLNLLPYHRIGASKYKKFNIPFRMNGVTPPSPERMKELKEYFEETGIKVKIGG